MALSRLIVDRATAAFYLDNDGECSMSARMVLRPPSTVRDCAASWLTQTSSTAIADPKHPWHSAMLEWVGGEFDPEAFDVDAKNGV